MSVYPGRGSSSVALPEVSSILFFPRLKVFSINVKFFLTRIEGLRTEHVVHRTDCKVIVIFGYINKTDLI